MVYLDMWHICEWFVRRFFSSEWHINNIKVIALVLQQLSKTFCVAKNLESALKEKELMSLRAALNVMSTTQP